MNSRHFSEKALLFSVTLRDMGILYGLIAGLVPSFADALLSFVWRLAVFGLSSGVALSALVYVAFYDVKTRLISTKALGVLLLCRIQLLLLCSYAPCLSEWFGLHALACSLVQAVVVCIAFMGMGFAVSTFTHQEALGFGDIKLLAVLLLWCPAQYVLLFLSVIAVIGVIGALAMKLRCQKTFAYAPVLVSGFIFTVILPFV